MEAFAFDELTGAYQGVVACQPDPLDGGYLLPAGATRTQPPTFVEGASLPFWTGDSWVIRGVAE